MKIMNRQFLPNQNTLKPHQIQNTKGLIESLRSGAYQQVTGCLKNLNGHCCLGVASVIQNIPHSEETILCAGERRFQFTFPVNGNEVKDSTLVPSDWWMEKYGWSYSGLPYRQPNGHIFSTSLVDLNDGRWSFKEIADLISATIINQEEYESEK